MSSTFKVGIVGAGLAGLSCALHLAKAGISFSLFEASDSPGGKLKTDRVQGFLLDRGFQVLLTAYPTTSRLLDYEALALKPFYKGALIRYQQQIYQVADPLAHPMDIFATFAFPGATLHDRYLIAKLKLAGDFSQQVTGQSTMQFLKDYGFSPTMINSFFKPFFGGIFLEDSLETAASKFAFVFFMLSKGAAALPKEGMQAIPRQMAAKIPQQSLYYNTPVQAIHSNNTLLTQAGETEVFDRIIVATDAMTAQRLLPNVVSTREYYAVSCFYYAAPKSPLSRPALLLNGEGEGPILHLCVPSDVVPDYAPSDQSLVSITVLGKLSSQVKASVESQLKKWFGSQVDSWRFVADYEILHAIPQFLSSQTNIIASSSETTVLFCGDYCSIPSIEGAIVSGQETAKSISHLS